MYHMLLASVACSDCRKNAAGQNCSAGKAQPYPLGEIGEQQQPNSAAKWLPVSTGYLSAVAVAAPVEYLGCQSAWRE